MIKNKKVKYTMACHKELLNETLKTEINLTEEEALILIKDYKYYGYDTRIKAHRYIIKNFDIKKADWIHIYYYE